MLEPLLDTPASLPELDGWEVWAGDGHVIAHATHAPRNAKDAYAPVQAIAICIAHNLLRLCGAKLEREEGIVDTKVIRAWHQRLAGRAQKATEAGRHLPLKLYQALYRPTEVSLQFIRWLRSMLLRATCYRQALALLRPLMEKYL